ncbi:VanZ family protein [Howardella ureilytica]|nr:VanZ family protein [Lachnospiraceae bacterium]MDY2956504.1 VanZ family protein [Lachnospiraceae bacterium]
MNRVNINKFVRFISYIAFAVYISYLIYYTFLDPSLGRNVIRQEAMHNSARVDYVNLVPFKEIKRFISNIGNIRFNIILLNVFGNIIAFVPFGFLLPIMSNRKLVWWSTILISAGASALIEMMQYVTKLGTCDIDDFILNTLGGILGYVCYRILFLIIDTIYRKRHNLN